ncbi:pyrrolidone-carboxylate peptidase-like isoform X1 [Phoenix dactylifera]|uniref:Pyrrolidone-carboxylate peptidase-like isoform X1 n=1 Tax=Phoenix dactylifera TaxID=42345 RepID=A0A8B7C7C9_PHODC|nr:pyrrolidone-carboxylate peptidase-like isoform X1 [Phoenix dactylifera]XP_038988840.1 pyrrolidone-carboxylate peptidase-like isoform X1 [Phoenix dactylifera]XP_038988841.1 pyrrolidone-carboxylate peptidase-like isoform X1 [Phoenix dactylifera]XP_038988842.1 pyrrolidone-carboxylate peptidase-like isoform X1 [Phoenix dactylifera]XP_038988843.1 pyrrolidone-carboxylate peptidase-like isoform X1 [Phoenix dactylifera]XP_038988844.1 pyrrolidone-carboxylate peptidase-like isoform X1 [Phoenix dactyl
MGSEGPSVITVHATGFKKFHGVSENPTETIVSNLKKFMEKKGLPKGLVLGNCKVLDTAGQGALGPLYELFESSVSGRDNESSNVGPVIWIHFGVNSGATRFAIENQAFNEATFRCPDELGWKPQRLPIVPSDGSISRTRQTSLPVNEIVNGLAKMGYDVMPSDDAGRFVCNYVYYQSLRFAEQHRIKSLFVHVPLFLTIDENSQMQFAASLLEVCAQRWLMKSTGEVHMLVFVPSSYVQKDG